MPPTRLTLAHTIALALAVGCGSSHGPGDAGPGVDASAGDAGRDVDASAPLDGGSMGGVDSGRRGPDAGTPPEDAGPPVDAGPRGTCDPEDARAEICPDLLCDGPGSWHWDGLRCVHIDCGACRGDDCGGATSQAECEAAHADCAAQRCLATGGTWRWWDELCGHYECGFRPEESCLIGYPGCQCGDDQRFVDGVGCVTVDDCPAVDPSDPQTLCEATGGTWTPDICCPTTCGEYCAAECLAPACVCGPMEVFDALRGCETAVECFERELGEPCSGGARCVDGTLCCDRCGGAGCAGNPTCREPVCDDDPDVDTCGNNLLAP